MKSGLKKISFGLSINYEDYLSFYQGLASRVRLRADNGQIIVFPASRLKPFLDHTGVHGRFLITYDEHNKFVSLERLTS
jgi:hypothetical protein